MSDTPKIYAAIAAVQAAVAKEGISKDRQNQQQGYKFRGIDDIYNAVAPLLSSNGLCILPTYSNRTKEERTTKSGGVLWYVTVEGTFDFVATSDGSRHVVKTFGEAMDSGDKATNKAMSAAYKYACMQTFCIPTEGDNDADSTTHEVLPHQSRPAQPPPQRPSDPPMPHPAPAPADVPPAAPKANAKKAPLTMATSGTRAAALDRLGCQEDGPEKNYLHSYLVALGWLDNEKSVEQWPIRFVPISTVELEAVKMGLAEYSQAGIALRPYQPHGMDPETLQAHPVAPPADLPTTAHAAPNAIAERPYPPHGLDPEERKEMLALPIEWPVTPPPAAAPAPEPEWTRFVMPFGRLKGKTLGQFTPDEMAFYQQFEVEKQPKSPESAAFQTALRAALDEAKATKKG